VEKTPSQNFRAFRGWRKPRFKIFGHFSGGENLISIFFGISRTEKTPFRFFTPFSGGENPISKFLDISQAEKTSFIGIINLKNRINMQKKILYIDMDNVLVDFASGIALLSDKTKQAYAGNPDDIPEWTNSAQTTRIEQMNTNIKICVNPENPRHLRAEKGKEYLTEYDAKKALEIKY
jgi:hypothetical protein